MNGKTGKKVWFLKGASPPFFLLMYVNCEINSGLFKIKIIIITSGIFIFQYFVYTFTPFSFKLVNIM